MNIRNATLPLTLSAVLTLSACANMTETQRNAGLGALGGAVGGAIIGKATGSNAMGRDAAIGAGLGALGGYVWSQRMEAQRQAMAQATEGTGVDVTRTADNQLKLEIPSDISFDVGKANIKAEMRPILSRFAQTLKDNPATHVRIVGHTDSTGSDAINNPLSTQRATSARDFLTDRGVAETRITIAGRGAREPVADNSTDAGRARNRRIEIFVAEAAPAQ
ncbi:OmpA family protein [Zoogloea sp.]|uniref:OmpA family protein n=1 Tax=Zoogloea sp. TaxID=49181 RepID=UPI002616F17E|nr:OmpA family protein [Zoogloea sp.]MDD3352027.1 OmpA family protein [Zoogloea sp.]